MHTWRQATLYCYCPALMNSSGALKKRKKINEYERVEKMARIIIFSILLSLRIKFFNKTDLVTRSHQCKEPNSPIRAYRQFMGYFVILILGSLASYSPLRRPAGADTLLPTAIAIKRVDRLCAKRNFKILIYNVEQCPGSLCAHKQSILLKLLFCCLLQLCISNAHMS